MEVGPLSRMLVAYASGQPEVKELQSTAVLAKLNAPATALFSTLGRIAARAIEAHVMAGQVSKWVAELATSWATETCASTTAKMGSRHLAEDAQGFGFHEAPRGSLGHWVHIEDKKIKNYQCVVPTTWNAGPRDAKGQRGAYEASLLKTPIADPERPSEILRTVHSFDPCLACAVHVVDARGTPLSH